MLYIPTRSEGHESGGSHKKEKGKCSAFWLGSLLPPQILGKNGEIIFGGGFFFFGNKKIGFPKPPVSVST
jgi:hypothetical protein